MALCLFNCCLRATWALGGCACTHTRQVCICECVRFSWASSGCNLSEPGTIRTQLVQTASDAVWALYDACGWGGAGFCHTTMVRDSPSLSPGNICLSPACAQVSFYEILVSDHRVIGCNTCAPLCDKTWCLGSWAGDCVCTQGRSVGDLERNPKAHKQWNAPRTPLGLHHLITSPVDSASLWSFPWVGTGSGLVRCPVQTHKSACTRGSVCSTCTVALIAVLCAVCSVSSIVSDSVRFYIP